MNFSLWNSRERKQQFLSTDALFKQKLTKKELSTFWAVDMAAELPGT
jgi:hypothetical protein